MFCRIIAKELALRGKYDFTDEDVERISLFSSQHYTGKNPEVIDSMINKMDLGSFEGIDVLMNIALFHHEKIDGSGSPLGLKRDEIPIEARIVAVADIFDAMTSQRPFKQAWSNQDAFATLRQLSRNDVDQDCVQALMKNQSEIEQIQLSFMEIGKSSN
jgi:HD-GYP domain-containing protein (c-di-GMP phosphodiesterase class II)